MSRGSQTSSPQSICHLSGCGSHPPGSIQGGVSRNSTNKGLASFFVVAQSQPIQYDGWSSLKTRKRGLGWVATSGGSILGGGGLSSGTGGGAFNLHRLHPAEHYSSCRTCFRQHTNVLLLSSLLLLGTGQNLACSTRYLGPGHPLLVVKYSINNNSNNGDV